MELGKRWLDVLAEDFEDTMPTFVDSDEEDEDESWHEWQVSNLHFLDLYLHLFDFKIKQMKVSGLIFWFLGRQCCGGRAGRSLSVL